MMLPASIRTAIGFGWRIAVLSLATVGVIMILMMPSDRFGSPEPVPEPAARRSGEPAVEPAAPRKADFPAIAAHPLFYPTRKPWIPPPPPAPPPPPPAPVAAPSSLTSYTLVGVVISDSMRSALVKAQANKVMTLSEGQEFEGWTLQSITPERLLFTAGDATYEMTDRKPSEIR